MTKITLPCTRCVGTQPERAHWGAMRYRNIVRTAAWRAWLGVLLLGVAAAAHAGTARWLQLTTPQYTVISRLDERQTRAWAAEFDLFIESVTRLLGFEATTLPPLTVVLFDDDRAFDAYRPPKPSGAVAHNVLGYFYRRETWGAIGLAAGKADRATRETIFHEGVHWITSADPAQQPVWFQEGLAELFSTFAVEGPQVTWGKPLVSHVELLRQHGLMPLREFLSQRTSLFEGDTHTGVYYAQAWALTHMLLLGGERGRAQLASFLSAWRTRPLDQAFDAAFGQDYATVQKTLRDYLDNPRMKHGTSPRPAVQRRHVVAPASESAVELALGRLALGSADTRLAVTHAARLAQLAPRDAATHELRTYIAQRDDDIDAAIEGAQAAVAAGSRDAEMHLVTAAATIASTPDEQRARADRIAHALRLNPRSLGGYSLLIDALSELDSPVAQDVELLESGVRMHPQAGFLQIGLAEVLYRLGRRPDATRLLDGALASASRLEAEQLDYARSLQSRWRFEEISERLDPLIAAGRYAEADQLLASVSTEDHAMNQLLSRLREFLQTLMSVAALPEG